MEKDKITINIKELDELSKIIFSKLVENKGNIIELEQDFYWDISEEELYDPYKEPNNITLGQLSDDIERINYICKFSDEIVNYDLKRLSSIMRALSGDI